MPRKKTEPEVKETVTLSVEVSQTVYEQICRTVEVCGFESVEDWLMDAKHGQNYNYIIQKSFKKLLMHWQRESICERM